MWNNDEITSWTLELIYIKEHRQYSIFRQIIVPLQRNDFRVIFFLNLIAKFTCYTLKCLSTMCKITIRWDKGTHLIDWNGMWHRHQALIIWWLKNRVIHIDKIHKVSNGIIWWPLCDSIVYVNMQLRIFGTDS